MRINGGWHGKILSVDLNRKAWEVQVLDPAVYYSYIGGKALAGHLFYCFGASHWNDSSPPIVIATGPLAATPVQAGGFATVFSRSPLTGTIGDYSFPGSLGTSLKKCGFDALVLTGRARDKIGLIINENNIEFIDLWSSTRNPGSSNICTPFPQLYIGEAAQKGIPFSNIITDEHWAGGRNGLGLCFSAKNIRYIRFDGNKHTTVHDHSKLVRIKESIRRQIYASPALMGEFGINRYGIGALFDLFDSRRMMPAGGFQETVFPKASTINACRFDERFSPSKTGCDQCPVQCMRLTLDGKALARLDDMLSFGPQLRNDNIQSIQQAATACNELGLDTVSTAHILLADSFIHNEPIRPDSITTTINQLIESSDRINEVCSFLKSPGPHSLFTIKNQHMLPYDPRGAYAMALSMALSTAGGLDSAFAFSHEILRKPVATDRFSFSGKARITATTENLQAAFASLAVCKLFTVAVALEEYAEALSAVTGIDFDSEALMNCGKRAVYQEHIINANYGFCSEEDILPEYFFSQPGTSGNGISVEPVPHDEFMSARKAYYAVRGLTQGGLPTKEAAVDLGLKWIQ